MKSVFVIFMLLFLSGCAGVASVVGCTSQVGSISSSDAVTYKARLTIKKNGKKLEDTESVVCKPKRTFCAGGDWHTEWELISPDYASLSVPLKKGEIFLAKVPGCLGLATSEGRGKKYYSYWSAPLIISEGDQVPVRIHSNEGEKQLRENSIDELGLEVAIEK